MYEYSAMKVCVGFRLDMLMSFTSIFTEYKLVAFNSITAKCDEIFSLIWKKYHLPNVIFSQPCDCWLSNLCCQDICRHCVDHIQVIYKARLDPLVNAKKNMRHNYFSMAESLQNVWVFCQKQVSRAGTNNYTSQYLRKVMTCSCHWYLLLAEHAWNYVTKRDPWWKWRVFSWQCYFRDEAQISFSLV